MFTIFTYDFLYLSGARQLLAVKDFLALLGQINRLQNPFKLPVQHPTFSSHIPLGLSFILVQSLGTSDGSLSFPCTVDLGQGASAYNIYDPSALAHDPKVSH